MTASDPHPPLTRRIETLAHTRRLAMALGRLLRPGDVIGLDGELGAGKTQWVRGIAEGLGIDPRRVSSPTFVVMQEYAIGPTGWHGASRTPQVLVHVDAYRVQDLDELHNLGWDELTRAPRDTVDPHAVLIEWASRVEPAMPDHALRIWLDHEAGESRWLEIDPAPPEWADRWPALVDLLREESDDRAG